MSLSKTQMRLLQQMCVDGGLRCHKRAAEEGINHNEDAAGYFFALRDRYELLREEIGEGYEAHDMQLILRQIYSLIDAEVIR